ncbi:hypothetical protein [Mesoterricola silvestris]|uniref:hypothetical protein n=1 Tax=Mesoterricola silvestris TaxID=2927979 RepID=UPI00292CEEF4|nr:hypothetical protein [Mesoterricola silvestris]
MTANPEAQIPSPAPVFTFSLTPFSAGLRGWVLVFFAAGVATAGLAWFRKGDPAMLFNMLLQVGLLALVWRRILRPLPSSVTRDGSALVFRDVPSFWMNIQGITVPLIVRREVRIPIIGMVPEWINSSLTWNDMEKGRTVFLARGEEAHSLVRWMTANGVAPPVGG